MLYLVQGRANTGKSKMVLEEICRQGESRRQILLVPDHASYAAEVDLCRFCGDTASRYGEVLTFRRLARRVMDETGGAGIPILDNGGKILMMQKALQDLSGTLTVYRHPSQKAAFLQSFIQLAEELQRYQVTPELLLEQSEILGQDVGDKLRDIALICGTYQSMLARDRGQLADEMDRLAEKLPSSNYVKNADIYLDGFAHFTAQEFQIIEILFRMAHSVTITLLAEENSRLEIFQMGNNALRRLRELAITCGLDVKDITLTNTGNKQNELGFIEKNFFGGRERWEEVCSTVHIREVGSISEEAACAASAIRSMVARQGLRYRDFGIVVRNMADYEATIENTFDRYEVPVYISRRSDLAEKPVIALVLYGLKAVTDGFLYEDMFRFLKTGLTRLSDHECDLIENYVLTWDISGAMWLREEPWTAHPEGYGAQMTPRHQQMLDEIQIAREKIRPQLAALRQDLRGAQTAAGKMMALYRFLEGIGLPEQLENRTTMFRETGRLQLADEYRQLWELLCHVMDQFVEILGDMPLSSREFYRLLKLVVSQYSVGTIPAALDQVGFSELSMNDRHGVKYLFLLGANDHVMPLISGDSLLSDDERDLLLDHGIRLAPHGLDKLHLELQNIYAALAKAEVGLWISYPTAAPDGSPLRPAFIISRLCTLFSQLNLEKSTGDKEYSLTAEKPAFDLLSTSRDRGLEEYFQQNETWSGALKALERGRSVCRGTLSTQAVQTLYGREIRLSASKIDQLRTCHFAYFMRYGLRVKERQNAAFDALQVGNFQHYILEHVMQDAARQGGIQKLDSGDLRKLTAGHVKDYLAAAVGDPTDQTARLRYLLGRLGETAARVVDNAAREMRNSSFTPLRFELAFSDADGELPALSIALPDHTMLHLEGKVDRVDGWIDGGKLYLRVVDYKTGKKSFELGDIARGMNLQMLLYLFALEKEGKQLFGDQEIVPAGVLYFPARDVVVNLPRGASPEGIQAALDAELRRSGMLLNDHKVLEAMEHDVLQAPRFLPLALDKDGNITKGVASAAELGKLSRFLDKTLGDIGQEIRQGEIAADPWYRSETDNACQFCEFASCCHFMDGQEDQCRYISKMDSDDFWRAVDARLAREEETTWEN